MPMPTIVEYYAKAGHAEVLARLLTGHWTVLHEEGLTTDQPAFLMRDGDDPDLFIEVFEWKEENGPDQAWENPRISDLWNQIQSYCEEDIQPEYYQMITSFVPGGG